LPKRTPNRLPLRFSPVSQTASTRYNGFLSGTPRPHLAYDLRVIFYEKYAIYYLPSHDEIVIVRVLHGSRDIATIADEGGFAI
jgi:ParE toxin of type II toxin-antitoxin system, parDE